MKAVPFISTMLNDEYRNLVSGEFDQKKINQLFSNWYYKDMVTWEIIKNHIDNTILEFYGDGNKYKIKRDGETSTLPYPKTINEFICDCNRCEVKLEWNNEITSNKNRIIFMNQDEIEKYNIELLTTIEKI